MQEQHAHQQAMEERLRHSAPSLRAADPARVDAACANIAAAAPLSPLKQPHTFLRPLLRVAACLLLMLGIALLTRPKQQPPALQPLPAFATLTDIKDLMVPQALNNSLACEAEDLASDLADLTAVLNERTFAILF